jgi:AraC-like DNA-binding protein
MTGEDAGKAKAAVQIFLPDARLQPYVTFYYFVEAFEPLTDFLYPEWGNVRFALSGEWMLLNDPRDPAIARRHALHGPTDCAARVVTTGGRLAGFGLTPLGWDRLIGSDAGAMANRSRELQDELGTDAEALRAAFIADGDNVAAGVARFDALLLDLLEARPANAPLVLAIDLALRERPHDVVAFARRVGVAPRTLQRLCLHAFGFPPKRLLRRQRFLETLGVIRVTSDAVFGAILDDHYFDQAHFNRDFRDFMGMTPREFVRTPRDLMQAAATAQAGRGITLSFRLPEPGVGARANAADLSIGGASQPDGQD